MNTYQVRDTFSPNGSLEIHTWQDNDKWWSCRSGVKNGLMFETDDEGPFETEECAKDWQIDGNDWQDLIEDWLK